VSEAEAEEKTNQNAHSPRFVIGLVLPLLLAISTT